MANTTTAMPSLNNDSPAILISGAFLGALADFRMPSTAIGSVGEIRGAEQQAVQREIEMPNNTTENQPGKRARKVEATTRRRSPGYRSPFILGQFLRLTCRAPANNNREHAPASVPG